MSNQISSLISVKTDSTKTVSNSGYNYGYLDEQTKRMIRRALLKAVAIPGYQVPFAGREMPMPYGWGTGGVQITATIIGQSDTLKVIDQARMTRPMRFRFAHSLKISLMPAPQRKRLKRVSFKPATAFPKRHYKQGRS